jgi:hypothetical protein
LLLRPGSPNPNGFCFAELSISLLFAQSKPWLAHHKHTKLEEYSSNTQLLVLNVFMVDQVGVEPTS